MFNRIKKLPVIRGAVKAFKEAAEEKAAIAQAITDQDKEYYNGRVNLYNHIKEKGAVVDKVINPSIL